MKTLGTKVNDDMYQKFLESSETMDVTVSESLRNLIEKSLTAKSDHTEEQRKKEPNINHVLSCPTCQIALADKGFIIMSTETYQKVRNYI